MRGNRKTLRRRTAAAYDVLRGRPPKPDYGLLIVLPVLASAGGALIGLRMDTAVNRRAAARNSTVEPGRAGVPELVHTSGEA
jgi:hypothetical protein